MATASVAGHTRPGVRHIGQAYLAAIALLCFGLGARAGEAGLVGHWACANAANPALDDSGRNNHGRIGAETECVKGTFGSALLFNGDPARVVAVPDSESLHFGTNDFSIECWICPQDLTVDAPDTRRRILSKNGSPNSWWVVDIQRSGKIVLEMADAPGRQSDAVSTSAMATGKWTHLVVVVDRQHQQVTFHFNGQRDNIAPLNPASTGRLDVVGAPLCIGGDWQLFVGLLNDVKLFNRALTDAEVSSAYDCEKESRASTQYATRVRLNAELGGKARYAVFNPHDAVEVRVTVTGARSADDRLIWSLKDFRERIVDEGRLTVPAGNSDWESTLRLADRPAGYYEVHLQLKKQGLTIPRAGSCPPGCLAFAVLPEITPLALAHPDDSRFGMQGTSNVSDDGDPFSPLYDVLGTKWLYDYSGEPWLRLPAWVEKTGPNMFKPMLDPKIHLEQKQFQMKHGLSAMFDLHSVPPWLMKMPDGKSIPPDKVVPSHNCQDYPPKDWAYYADLLTRLVSEKSVLRAACYPYMRHSYYQIHWEPDWYWKGSDEAFIRMYEVASTVIRKEDFGAFLLGPNYGVLAAGDKLLERLFAKGLGKYLDGVVIHSYFLAPSGENGSAPEAGGLVQDARKLMRLVRQYLPPGAPVMNTEGSSRINGVDAATNPWVLRRQAAWFLRNHLICLGEGFTSTWFFLLADHDVSSGYGLFYNLSLPQQPYNARRLAPKPVFSATVAATRLLEGTRSICPIEYLGEHALGYCFERQGQLLVALWSTDDQARTIALPVGHGKVSFYDPMGNRSDLRATDGMARVSIDGNPVYLLGVAREAMPVAASDLAGYPGQSLAFPNRSALPAAKYSLFRGGLRQPAGASEKGPVTPATTQPGTWLLQSTVSGELKASWLVTVNDPVNIQPSCAKIMDRFIDLTLENRTDVPVSGHVRLRGVDCNQDAGALTLLSGEKRSMRVDLAGLKLASPVRRTFAVEFEDQHGVVSRSADMTCAMTPTTKASRAPVIDGDLSDWAKAPFYLIHGEDAVVIKNPEAPLLGDDDLSFRVASQYDDKALYLAVKVRDQSHVQTRPNGDSWQEDSVQIGLACDWDGTKWNVWQKLCIALGQDGTSMVRRNNGTHLPSGDVPATAIPCVIKRTDGETCYELAIPWRVIDPRLTGVPPQRKLGIGILVNDVDAPPAAGVRKKDAADSQQAATEVLVATAAANPKRKAMEAYGGMVWGKPEEFGVLLLSE